MHIRLILTVAALAAVFSIPVSAASDAREILEEAREKQIERWEGVDLYVVEQETMGGRVSTWFRRFEFENSAGDLEPVFLPVPASQVQRNQCSLANMSDEDLATVRSGTEMMGEGVADEIEDGLENAGLPRELLGATGSDPWNSMDPRVMMSGYADFLEAGVDAQREADAVDYDGRARSAQSQMEKFIATAELMGTESVEGTSAYLLQAAGFDEVQQVDDGQEYRMETMSVWIDTHELVPVRMRMDGTLSDGRETRPMTIENVQTDYRSVPGSDMYESHRQVMKISGMLDDAQKAEMAEAQKQLAEFEKELANMPPSQRKMVENMMGGQMDMIRKMASGGGMEFEVLVSKITVNPPLVDRSGAPCPGM